MQDSKQQPLGACDIVLEARLSFPSLFTPRPKMGKTEAEGLYYSTALLLPPTTDWEAIKRVMAAAKFAKWEGNPPKGSRAFPSIRKCDEVDEDGNRVMNYAGYEPGWCVIRTSSKRRPAVVDNLLVPVTEEARVYPGVWVNAFVTAWAWHYAESARHSVSWNINAIQLLRDDERLDGRIVDISSVFTPVQGALSEDLDTSMDILDDGDLFS